MSWTLIRFRHLLAMAFFVGGQIMLVVAVVVLVATGVAMASHLDRWHDDTLQLKLALVLLVGVLLGLHAVAPRSRSLSLAVLLVSLAIVRLGVELAH